MKVKQQRWPRQVQPGRTIITVYRYKNKSTHRRKYGDFIYTIVTPKRNPDGRVIRQWNRYTTEADALAAADSLAKRRDELGDFANNLSPSEAIAYASSEKALRPLGISVVAACE